MKFALGFLFLFSSLASAAPDTCTTFKNATASGPAAKRLKRFIDAQWKYAMTTYPEFATYVGYPGQNDRWTDMSLPAIERRKKESLCMHEALKKISRKELKGSDLVNFDLLLSRAEMDREEDKFPGEFLAISHLGGVHSELADTLSAMPMASAQDAQNVLARLEKASTLIAQNETLLRQGLKRKLTPVKMFMQKVPAQFDKIVTADVKQSPLYKPFAEMRGDFSAEEIAKTQERAQQIIAGSVYPALKKFREFVEKEYIPASRETISWKDMPNGAEWYAFFVRRHTTTKMKPEELHQLGLKEVERIGAEMKKIRDQVKFKGDAKDFNKFLLTDKQFYYTKKEDLLMGYRDIAKRVDSELPKLFKTLPRLPYGVREMPEFKAKDSPTAYYLAGSIEGGRAGYFEANTYDLKARPKWGMEALTIHEAVPGHHLQIAISQELTGLPEFRKHMHYTAFVEGWALYSESLGEDMGFYKDPYSKYGQLSYEMWRAVRLVVDTGMHQLGWSRQQAIDYMMAQMPKSHLETEVEIDRYITWPGQALAYKVGELKIRELRSRARAALGEDFDVREFHDEVLKNGALPMDVLDKSIETWIGKRKKIKKTQT